MKEQILSLGATVKTWWCKMAASGDEDPLSMRI
jgi:hypothetical protein